jgi:hypothetical protein
MDNRKIADLTVAENTQSAIEKRKQYARIHERINQVSLNQQSQYPERYRG